MNLTALREALDHEGPFASVHLDASHDTEDAAKLTELRWREVRTRLTEQDAPGAILDALDDAVDRSPPEGRAGRLLVAAGGEVLVDEYLTEPPPTPVVRVSPLPYLLPLADWHLRDMPHVVATVDKTGAELRAVHDEGGHHHTEDVTGQEHPVHKIRGGGLAQYNIERHTEETVRRNIGMVAEEVARLARLVDARLVVLAGDAEPRARLRDALPESCRRIAVEIEHGRPDGHGPAPADRALDELLTERRRGERDRVVERFLEASGHRLAVEGLVDTAAALRTSNVEVLMVDGRTLADATVWTGGEANLVSADSADLERLGVPARHEARADEALVAAALSTGAEVLAETTDDSRLDLTGGVGAILRHT